MAEAHKLERDGVTYADIERARRVVAGKTLVTSCAPSRTLSEIFGCRLWLKFENLQFTASFKERGALNRLAALSDEYDSAGVVAMSAGNHAQGVAYHARNLGIPATIVMPVGTPNVKVENTRRYGANVIVEGRTLEEASTFAHNYGQENDLNFIHPYDDPLVIAGQGTIACEMLEQVPEIDTLVIPIGGGGLAAGMATAARAIKPQIKIIGVQAELFPSMYNVFKGEHMLMQRDSLAEGIAVKSPGHLTRQIIAELVDDIVLVSEEALERAVALLINIEKTVVEGAGAAGIAAILSDPERFAGANVATVLCGGNIDTRLLAGVLTRDLARDGRLSRLAIDLVDQPGYLAGVANVLSEVGANIVEVAHQRVFSELPAKAALLDVVIETRDRTHLDDAVRALRTAGFRVEVGAAPTAAQSAKPSTEEGP